MQTIATRTEPEQPPAALVLARLARRYPVWVPAIQASLEQARRELAAAAMAELLGKPVEAAGDVANDV